MFFKMHNAAEAVKLCEAGARFCDKIRTLNIAQVFASFLFKLFYIQWLYFLALSLVFICRENPRRSGILLFPDRPRFCRLMKTRNRRYRRSSAMNGDKSGQSERFYLPDASQISAMIDDHPRQRKTQICTIGDVGVRWRWISLITNPLNCLALVPLNCLALVPLNCLALVPLNCLALVPLNCWALVPLNCLALVPLSQINVAFLENLGQTSDEYLR